MKGASKTVFAIVLFFTVLSIFLAGFGLQAASYQSGSFTNQTNINMTLVNTGLANVQVCNFQSDIPIIGGLIWGADCIGDGLSVLLGLATANTDNVILGVFFFAIVITLIVIIIGILRGVSVVG